MPHECQGIKRFCEQPRNGPVGLPFPFDPPGVDYVFFSQLCRLASDYIDRLRRYASVEVADSRLDEAGPLSRAIWTRSPPPRNRPVLVREAAKKGHQRGVGLA